MKQSARLIGLGLSILSAFALIARAETEDPAKILFASANKERAAHGLAALKWSAPLAAAAQQHAQRMAGQNTISHQFPGEPGLVDRASQSGARFRSLAENVALGPSAERIHQQWMHSPHHRANILDAKLDSLGIAVTERDGVLFAVQDFSLAAEDLSQEEEEGIVDAKLKARGLHTLAEKKDARRSCSQNKAETGAHAPSLVMHYTTADLQTLPDSLENRIQSGGFHSAAVGACPNSQNAGFSEYRIAILLYQ